MKTKLVALGLLLAVTGTLFGCAMANAPVSGMLYMDVKGGVDAEGAVGGKEGTACATSILGWIATGDASITTAANNGGIKTVTNVDHKSKGILGLYAEYCTIVSGK